jgi:hypothetical protein
MTMPEDRMGPPAPHERIPPKPDERPAVSPVRRRQDLAAQRDAENTARHMVRMISADPVKIQWLRDYGARLLEAAAQELREHMVALEIPMPMDPALVLDRRAREHRSGETALW